MSDPIIVTKYDQRWPEQFQRLAQPIRKAMGDIAQRIDHIGSTAVPELAAKPVIDMQISVVAFEPFHFIRSPLESLGYCWQEDNPDLTKRFFRESPGTPRTHIHVRVAGSWSEQAALLFRDYLRVSPEDKVRYAGLKRQLAEDFRNHREGYVEAKSPFIWEVMRRANGWSQQTGWIPSESDD